MHGRSAACSGIAGRSARDRLVSSDRRAPGPTSVTTRPSPDLRTIPGVGKATEGDLNALGIHRTEQLVGCDPEELYLRLCAFQGGASDRCNLYVYRCAVYCAEGGRDPELLRWWAWKDSVDPPLRLLGASRR